jgi:hypothetical protein
MPAMEHIEGASPQTNAPFEAPVAEAPPQSPQPAYEPAVYRQPVFEQPAPPPFALPPAKRGPRKLLIGGIVAAVLILALGGGGALANASLSATYGPSKAVTDYLAAQSRGDVHYMVANANYLKGDGGTDAFFGKDALTSMMAIADNKAISNVKVTSVQELDSTTSKVTVSMTWAGHDRTQAYTVHKDQSRSHYVLYNSWLVDIPASTISVSLPNQPGAVEVDGISTGAGAVISVIQGFHTVAMMPTAFYDGTSQTADATGGTASVIFKSALSAGAVVAAANVIRDAFKPANVSCDAAAYFDCPNHTYRVPAGYYFIIPMPGGGVRTNSSWVFSVTGDPTAGMQLVIGTEQGKIAASGTCTMKLVVDGSRTYQYRGTWQGTLTWSNGRFDYDGDFNCDQQRA